MFNTISWQGYWTALAITTAIYYCAIALLYYRNEFKATLLSRSHTRAADQSFVVNEEEFKTPGKETEEGIVYSCMDEVNAFFEEAMKQRWHRTELIYALQQIIKKYPSINTSGYKASVSNVLRNQCEHVCNIHLSSEELNHVWLG